MNSILTSIKKLLGLTEEDTSFDADIIMHINTVFFTLWQLGIGPNEVYSISDKTNLWTEFVSKNNVNLNAVKSYMFMRVKILFDQTLSASTVESMKSIASEYEYRMFIEEDNRK